MISKLCKEAPGICIGKSYSNILESFSHRLKSLS